MLGAILVCATALPAQAGTTVILCGRLIDGRSDAPRLDAAIVVEGRKIVSVGGRQEFPRGATVIDLGGATVLPGLIDAHVHPLIATDDYQTDHLRHSSARKALSGLKVVQDLLQAGWTALRIAGDADVHYAHLDLRDAIDEGLFTGPRIVGAGHYISTTGGGGDINFISPEQAVVADGLVVDGVDSMRRAVREEIKHGSDWIKILVTGAFMSAGDNPREVHFSPQELEAVVQEAERRGVPVMAHAHSAEGIRLALQAGVRSIEHGTFIDDEGILLMKERGTYLVPTLYLGEYYLQEKAGSAAQRKMIDLTLRYREEYRERVGKAINAGVKVGLGTDNVGFPAAYSAREFAELVSVGMSPMEAIQAGTRVNAELLGLEKEIGTIEPGKHADIIAVEGDPLEEISELERVTFVMIGGQVVKSP
jgi:imidazolonepropionase-like amidohydrolase